MTDYSIAGSSGTTGLSHWTSPTPAGKLAVVDPSDTTTPPAGSAGSDKWASIGQLLGVAGYVFPSGDATGAADVTAINNIIANGGACVLPWTGTNWTGGQQPFVIGSPLLPATGSSLTGAAPWMASETDDYGKGAGTSGGSVLVTPATFAGTAVIDLVNTTGTQAFGVTLKNFSIDGAGVQPVGHGIRVHGAWGACIMEGVCVNGPFADCLHFEADATQSVGPDDWRVAFNKFAGSFTGYGVWADNIPDSWFIGNEASGNALDNWWLGFSLNTKLIGNKGENSGGGVGFHLTGQGGAGTFMTLADNGTHLNNKDGFLFDGTSSGSTGGRYLLSNCVAIQDGQAGGTTYGGFRSVGSVAKVIGSNCMAQGAAYGAAQISTSAGMDFTHSTFSGTTANLLDDGSNAAALVSRNSPDQVRVTLGTAFTSASNTSAQNVTGMSAALAPGIYQVTAWIPMTPSGTTGSTHTFAFTFGGTVSAASVSWQISWTTTTGSAGTSITTASAVSPTMTAAGMICQFAGKVTVTASGTLQLTTTNQTAADLVTVPVGAWINIEPVAS